MKQHKVLILEDDLDLRDTLEEALMAEGFNTVTTDSSDTVIDLTFNSRFDLYLFDVNVIGMDGFELLHALREAGDETPAIFLTSKKNPHEVVEGFSVGASDYMKKPFDMDELLARIMRFLQKKKQYSISGTITYLPESYEVVNNERKVALKEKEALILEYFLENKNKLISKDQILESIYKDEYITDSTFRGYINRIKNAIGKEYLRNIRGRGYIFEAV